MSLAQVFSLSFAANNDDGAAVKLARESDVAIVCVGNHPNGDKRYKLGASVCAERGQGSS